MRTSLTYGLAGCVGLALVLGDGIASAQTHPASASIGARVPMLFGYRNQTGATLPLFRASPELEATGLAPLLVRFRRAPTPAELAKYRSLGFRMGRQLASGAVEVRARED